MNVITIESEPSTSTDRSETGEGADKNSAHTITSPTDPKKPTSGVETVRPKPKRLSGAQQRKLRREARIPASAGPSLGRKRPNPDQTGVAWREKPKRPRDTLPASSTDVPTWYRMAVVPQGLEATLSEVQADLIQSRMVDAIDDIPLGETPPQFHSCKLEQGLLWVTCANLETKKWLMETVPKLKGLWEGAVLGVLSTSQLFKRRKVVVWIPDISEESVVRTRLARQNPDLNANGWSLLSVEKQEAGQSLVYYIDKKSFDVLERDRFKAFWCLGKVTFKNLSMNSR